MSPTGAKRAVVGLAALTAAASIYNAARRGRQPRMRIMLGAMVLAVVLSAVADAAPTIAVGMAATVAITAALVLGPDAIRNFGTSVRKASAA